MMHEQFKCHDACSNAVRLMFNLISNSQNWLEHRVSNKNPNLDCLNFGLELEFGTLEFQNQSN